MKFVLNTDVSWYWQTDLKEITSLICLSLLATFAVATYADLRDLSYTL